MLAMVARPPLEYRQPTLSLTNIATVRRLDMLAPTRIKKHKKGPTRIIERGLFS